MLTLGRERLDDCGVVAAEVREQMLDPGFAQRLDQKGCCRADPAHANPPLGPAMLDIDAMELEILVDAVGRPFPSDSALLPATERDLPRAGV